jgi:hypothetical protein
MPRHFSEPLELEDIFERDEAARRRTAAAEVARQHQLREEREAEAEAARREEARLFSLRVNAGQVMREYLSAGVEPVSVYENGTPTCSLSLLLSIGWTIREIDGHKTLIEPPPAVKRKTREDYERERNEGLGS